MYLTLAPSQKFAATLASAIVAGAALILALKLNFAPAYPDFIVGSITWRNEAKLQDLLVGPIVIAVFSFCLLYLVRQFDRLNHETDFATADGAIKQLLWWSVPALFSIGLLSTGAKADGGMVLLSAAGIVLTAWALVRAGGGRAGVSPETAGWGFFAVILLGLIPIEVALVLGRLPANHGEGLNLQSYIYATYAVTTLGFVGLAAAIQTRANLVARWLPLALAIGQVGAAILVFDAYPARLLSPGGVVSEYRVNGMLPALLAALALWAVFDVVSRFRRFRRSEATSLSVLLSPIALFFLIAVAKAGYTSPPQINPDDFHFGEHLVGWWSYLRGMVPYVDYLPPHGLIDDDLAGLLSSIFFDGTAATLAEANRLAFWLLAFATVISVHRFSGSVGLALIAAFFLGGRLAWLFLTPFLCLWFSQSLRASPSRWLAAWIVTAPIIILGVPPQGIILVAAALPYALFLVWQGRGAIDRSRMKAPALALGFLLLLSVFVPLPSMLFGAIRYVWENGPNNQVAYGVPWAISLSKTEPSWVFLELVRMSWIAVPLVCLFLAQTLYARNERRIEAYMPCAVAFVFAILLIPYSMGRIDPASLSRPGLAAQFGWIALIPLVSWEFISRSANRQLLMVAIVVAGAALGGLAGLNYVSITSFLHAAYGKAGTGVLRDGGKLGLPNLGIGDIKDDHLERLVRLNRALTQLLGAGETYLDLTSRSAHYFYLDKPPPVPVTAPYNMVSLAQQQRAIDQLKLKSVRVALLQADNLIHDGGGLALRSPLLFRFIMDNYLPVWLEGFVFGIRKDQNQVPDALRPQAEVRNLSDGNWERGIHRREAAFVVGNAAPFTVGSVAQFGNGDTRRIVRIWNEGNAIWVDGAPLDSAKTGAPNKVTALMSPEGAAEHRARLLDASFIARDLGKIPVSWGRSESSLQARMTLTSRLDAIHPLAYQLLREGSAYKVAGADPQLLFDIAAMNISGRQSGLLRFDFQCAQRKEEPRLQVYWWGDAQNGPTEEASLKFTADDGALIVPLDAYPRWLALDKVRGIRVDLDNPRACSSISIGNVSLHQRLLGE